MTETPELRERLTFAVSVVEAIEREIRDGVLPEWFRHEWFHDELVPVLREALTAIPPPPGPPRTMTETTPEGATCAECWTRLHPANLAQRVADVANAPDGLPAPVLVFVCKRCAAGQRVHVWTWNEFGEPIPSRPLRGSWEWRLIFSDWCEDTLIPWLRTPATPRETR